MEKINIEIDPKVMQEGVNKASQDAIEAACNSYSVKNAIQEAFEQSILQQSVTSAISQAIEQIDFDGMVHDIAATLTKTITSATVMTFREAAAATMCKFKGFETFQPEYRIEKNKIVKTLLDQEGDESKN